MNKRVVVEQQWPQYLAATTATLSLAVTGAYIGWTSPTLPLLKDAANSPLLPGPVLSSSEASWVASFYLLGSIPGNVLAGFALDALGRKNSLLLAGLPLALGWLMLLWGRSAVWLMAARFVAGLGQGLVYVVGPVYIGEIAAPRIRGSLGSLLKLQVTLGELYAHALGPYVSYEALGWSCLLLPALFLASFGWMPESPHWLAMRGRRDAAERSLLWLGRVDEDADELAKAAAREARERGRPLDLWRLKGNRRAALVCLGLQLVLQLSGIAAVESYTQEMLEGGGAGQLLSAPLAVIALSLVQLVAGMAAAALVDRVGRRPLLLATSLLAGLALTCSAVFYLLKRRLGLQLSAQAGLVLVASVIGYELAVALGLSPLAYMMLGELFPNSVKGFAVSLANLWASLLAFFVSKMYQVVTDSLGIESSFACFASAALLGLIFILLCVPETKGKSLLEIQQELNRACPAKPPKPPKPASPA